MNRLCCAGFLLVLVLASMSCGYHTAGSAVRLPPDVRTIAIPMFENQTKTYRIEQFVTDAVVHEMTGRTNYRVISKADSTADAVLTGIVLTSEITPVTYDSQTGRASSALVTMTARVKLTDRKGKVLFENPNYTFRDQYQISADLSSFFEEDSPAMQRMSRDFARTLISNVLEAF